MMYNGAKETIVEVASNSRNGRRLYDIGRVIDIEYCLQWDVVNVIPQYNEGKITLVKDARSNQ
ncbi:2-phosphosulfolactate phosphatase [Sporomusa silvacetica]|uniref:2-phosphosulfolactate phosphatase n=1 Tax=Sporomusa silvacetica TaxID=55504 RepID=UPI001181877C